MIAFLIWEIVLLAASIRLAGLIGYRPGSQRAEEYLFLVAALDVSLCSAIAQAFSFAKVNARPLYWVVAAVLLGASVLSVRHAREAAATARQTFRDLAIFQEPYCFALVAAAFSPLVFLSFRPVADVDSMNYLHYLLDWMANRANPYAFATNYSPFWEISFLPSWILTRSDAWFPLIALKALVILSAAIYLLAVELGLPRRLSLLATAAMLSFRYYWGCYSGVGTLKNDALHAAGEVILILMVLRAVRGAWRSTDWAILASGAVFASAKSSGILFAALCLVPIAILRRQRGWWRAVLIPTAVFVALTGQYYLHNLLTRGNPFYPYQINLLFLHLPGLADQSGTSILWSLRDPRLWRAFFWPSGGVSTAGLLFPLTLAATLFFGAVFTIRWLLALLRGHLPDLLDWLAVLLCVGWYLYFRSFWSASATPGDLIYVLNGLGSIRYASGILAASELFLLALLMRWGLPGGALMILAAVNLCGRLWTLYQPIEPVQFSVAIIFSAGLAAGLLTLLLARRWPALWAVCAAGVLLCATPWIMDRNRTVLDEARDIWEPVSHFPAASVYLVDDPLAGYCAIHYLLAGSRLQQDVLCDTEAALITSGAHPRYIVRRITPENRPEMEAFRARLNAQGYYARIATPDGIVLEYRERPELR